MLKLVYMLGKLPIFTFSGPVPGLCISIRECCKNKIYDEKSVSRIAQHGVVSGIQ